MNIIRMTAFIAVTMTAFACDSGNKSQFEEKQIRSANLNYLMPGNDDKTELEMKTEYTNEGLYADSIGKPETPGEKQKQQQSQHDHETLRKAVEIHKVQNDHDEGIEIPAWDQMLSCDDLTEDVEFTMLLRGHSSYEAIAA